MKSDSNDYFDFMEDENPVQIKQLIGKYLRYWPWFLATVTISLTTAFFYLCYADVIYTTEAKVKLLTDKENSNFSLDITKMFSKSTINLENEITLFKSVRLSEQVVQNLDLNVEYIYNSTVTAKRTFRPPFKVSSSMRADQIQDVFQFSLSITKTGYTLLDEKSGKTFQTKGYWLKTPVSGFPIQIEPVLNQNLAANIGKNYTISIRPVSQSALQLSSSIAVSPEGEDSDIVSISLNGTDGSHSEKIVNTLIRVFELDGISDKQLVSHRTIAFVDERFVYLQKDLDSIEIYKKEYKKSNALSFIQEDAGASIIKKSTKDEALFAIESQLLLAELLADNLNRQTVFELLPADIGLQSSSINQLVSNYNASVLEYQKLHTSAGDNNPAIQVLVSALASQKKNVILSVKGYKQQLESSRAQSRLTQKTAEGSFSSLPEKEKVLRSIERQQNLKESLYLLLLQKREEASINLAVTVANTKIIDYAITNSLPVSPQGKKIYLGALLLGLLVPFGILFLIFKLDNKIHSAHDVEVSSKNIPILAELPSVAENSNSAMQNLEAFRTLAQNTSFIIPFTESSLGKVLFVTSSIKGEGKTFVSYHLAHAYSHLDKKVLVVGTDFRNPQLHKYLKQTKKENKGLSNYLHEPALQWQDLVCTTKEGEYPFSVLLAGAIPPNPALLLSNSRFKNFIEEVKKEYDIIIFDTPPTLLVSDTLIISKYADTTLYVMRSGLTEKNLIAYSNKLASDKKIMNMGYVINDVNFNSTYGYGYNYGYGYGYGRDSESKPWYRKSIIGKLFSK